MLFAANFLKVVTKAANPKHFWWFEPLSKIKVLFADRFKEPLNPRFGFKI